MSCEPKCFWRSVFKYHLKKVDSKEILIFDKIWFLEDFKCEPI